MSGNGSSPPKRGATRTSSDSSRQATASHVVKQDLPNFYFDGSNYFRPCVGGFDRIKREDATLHLRKIGFAHRTAKSTQELSPCEEALYQLQIGKRVDYAGPLCGRPPGLYEEIKTRILCTRGPTMLDGMHGDSSPLNDFLFSLLGQHRDSYFEEQLFTFCGWLARARMALRNPDQHLPGQALALVGPRDCGKSLLQSLVTVMLGSREADPTLWLLKGSAFNSDLWAAEHLRLGDEELAEDGRERHLLRDRLKKLVVADLYPLHAKYRDAQSFRPIWRVTISGNEDGQSIAVLPPPTDSFADKIIYLKCFPPATPYHDGSEEAARAFWQRLMAAVPAFLDEVETTHIPEQLRSSRFYVREFHHPAVIELITDASPVAPLGELLGSWVSEMGEPVTGFAGEIFEQLSSWVGTNRINRYSKSAGHFGHQLSRLREFPRWSNRIRRVDRRIGANRQRQSLWEILP